MNSEIKSWEFIIVAGLAFLSACTGSFDSAYDGEDGTDAGPLFDDLDKGRAQEKYRTTTDIMRFIVAPGCAAETNECHSNEDFPDLHTEGNLWNLVDLPCNLGVGDRTTIEDFCEAVGDELRITDGANASFTATIGSIEIVSDETGEFDHYLVRVENAPAQSQSGATFEIVRAGMVVTALGGGSSLEVTGGSNSLMVMAADDIDMPQAIAQGDENQNGVFGTGEGVIVRAGDANTSYMVRRLLAMQTERVRMPLNENADNPTETNRILSPDEMYAIMSWINCMQEGDGIGAPIHYDCAGNANNEGALQ